MQARILIVEDEPIVAKIIDHMLIKQEYRIAGWTKSGEEAIILANSIPIDLALMDITLAGELDGIQTAQILHSKFDIPVVFMTSGSDEQTIEGAVKTHPYGYILKPVEYLGLYATIRMALNIHSTEKRLRESETQFKTLIDTSLDGVWITENERFIDVNQAYCQMTGYSREEILAMDVTQLEAVESSEKILDHMPTIETKGWDRFETQHLRKDGSRIDLEISASYIPQLKRFISLIRNISENKRSAQEILSLNQELTNHSQEILGLYEAERTQRELAENIVEASRVIVSTLDVETVLDLIIDQIGRIVRNDICSIMLVDGDSTRVLRSRGYKNFNPTAFIETYVFPLSGQSIRNEIISSGEALVVPDIQHDVHIELSPGSAWLRSYIAVPIQMQNEVVGLINVGISIPGFYNQWHAARLQAFAYQAAIAMRNARMYEEMKRTAKDLEALSHRLLDIQETERRQVARELHDEIGQALTAVQLRIEALRHTRKADEVRSTLDECTQVIGVALKQVRSLSLDLHPSILDDLGLVPALRWYIDHQAPMQNFSVQLSADSLVNRLPAWCEQLCYRVVQEALTNIYRHARAANVAIELWERGADLHLIIRDDGVGFDVRQALERAHVGGSLGLISMRERVNLVKGVIEIQSTPGEGAEIHVRIPVEVEQQLETV